MNHLPAQPQKHLIGLHPPWRVGRKGLCGLLLMAMLILMTCMPTAVQAQVELDTFAVDGEEPIDDGAAFEVATGAGNEADTSAKKVREKTDLMDPMALMNGGQVRRSASFDNTRLMYSDLLERQGGFSMTLGQWGMPYQRNQYGTDAANFDQGNYINPITGAENVYFLDPEHGMRYYDTRTPYLNAYYSQGKADASQMRVDVSQNVHPLVNVAGLYLRQQCKGVYTNLVTDHNTVGASANFHTLDDRHHSFAHFLVQQHKDQLNGGVIGIQPESTYFNQGTQPVALSDANLLRSSKAVALRHFYAITVDSLKARHAFGMYAGFFAESLVNEFADMKEVSPALNTLQFPTYPTLGDSSFFIERMALRRIKFDGGLSYRYNGPVWKSQQRLELAQELIQYKRFFQYTALNRSSILWKGQATLEPNPRALDLAWNYRQTFSNLFPTESYAEVNVGYHFPKWQLDYTYKVPGSPRKVDDSLLLTKTYRPLGLLVHTLSYGRNPTLQQAVGQSWPGNNFQSNLDFNNRRIRHLKVGLELKGKSRWTPMGEQTGNYMQLSAFSTRQTGMIYFQSDTNFTSTGYVQASNKAFVGYFGGELKLRLHWKRFYLETETVAQGFGTNSKTLEAEFLKTQPKFYSKTSIFYENYDLKFARLLRFGLDYWYFSTYTPSYFDPASQAFYSQGTSSDYSQFAYPRADVFVATQVKKAFIFVKFINLLEGVPQLGYFTTMGYPMQIRQLQLGLNWTFFD